MTSPRFLLDTDTCIYLRRSRPIEVVQRFRSLRPGEAVMSVVVWGELLYGAEKNPERVSALRQLQELSALLPVIPMLPEVAEVYGALRALLETKGEMIGNNDLWIAAHAKSANLIVVTNNQREFQRVPGLTIETWVGGS